MTILKAPYWLGKHLSEEHKINISKGGKGLKRKPFTEEHKKNMSKSCKGKKSRLGIPCSEEAKRNISKSLLGNKICLGRILSEETKNKISESHKGQTISKKTKIKMSEAHKNYSKETREKLFKIHKEQMMGENNPNWKNGITSLQRTIRSNYKYRQWRSDVFTRDEFTCQKCSQWGGTLHAHHIKSFANILQFYEITTLEEALECEELWNINNGITLCKKCHQEVKNIDSKKRINCCSK